MGDPRGEVLDLRAVFGLKAIVTTSASETNGSYVEMDVLADPGSRTMIHYHPEQEETYEVMEGVLDVFQDGAWRRVSPGALLTIPPRTVHGFRNTGAGPVRFVNVHRPARGFQAHLETLARLHQMGKIRGTKDPRSLIFMSMSAVKHQPDVTVKPPQRLIQGLAFIGSRLRFRLDDEASPETSAK